MLDAILVSGFVGGLIVLIILGSAKLFLFIRRLVKDVDFRKNLLLRLVKAWKHCGVILVLILGIGSLFYWYELRIASRKDASRRLLEIQQQDLEKAKLAIKNLEESKENKSDCEDISLDRTAPGYTGRDLEAYVDELNSKGATKNLGNADLKYLIDQYFASQWATIKPECSHYIDSLVEERRHSNIQNVQYEKQIEEISNQQEKLLRYNQCLTASDQPTCQFLLY